MAYLDQTLLFSTAQPITVSTPSTAVYDITGAGLGIAPALAFGQKATFGADMGSAEDAPSLIFTVASSFTSAGGATLQVQVQGAIDNGNNQPGAYTTIVQTGPFTASQLIRGASFQLELPSITIGEALPRFYRLNYIVAVSTFTAGSVSANLTLTAPNAIIGTYYPSALSSESPTGLPSVSRIALMGDSITAQNSSGIHSLDAIGYATWARTLTGAKFDFAPQADNSALTFATGGFTSTQIVDTWLKPAIASSGQVVIDLSGTNDIAQSVPLATTRFNRKYMWSQIKASGKYPVAMAITPITLNQVGNNTGALSAQVVIYNAALKLDAFLMGVPWIDGYVPNMELTPGTGIGNPNFYYDGNLHPNPIGAAFMGRALASVLKKNFKLINSPLIATGPYLSTNYTFNSGTAPSAPDFYQFFGTGGYGAWSYIQDGPVRWARTTLINGVALNPDQFDNPQTPPPGGLNVEVILRMFIESGTVGSIQVQSYGDSTLIATDHNAATLGGTFSSLDTPTTADALVFRVPAGIAANGTTTINLISQMQAVNGNAVVWFQLYGARLV